MGWEVRIQYADGREKTIRSYQKRDTALRYVDALYAEGYPMHLAYVVRPVVEQPEMSRSSLLQFA